MPKINYRRKNRTDGTRSGGGSAGRHWWDGSKDDRCTGWHKIRQFVRAVIFSGASEHAPPSRMTRRGSWASSPGWEAPRVSRGDE